MLIIKRKLGETEKKKKKHAVLKGRVILVQRTGMAGMRTWLSSAKYINCVLFSFVEEDPIFKF